MNDFLVADPDKCIGCRTCEIACALAHAAKDALIAGTLDQDFHPRLKVVKIAAVTVPVQCRQCEDAPCANVCPTGAIINKHHSIQVKGEACIGCKSCLLACPFGVMELAPQVMQGETVLQEGLKVVDAAGGRSKEKLVAYKCDLCRERPEGPACAGVCPTQAFKPVAGQTLSLYAKQRRKACAVELSRLPPQAAEHAPAPGRLS
ncbi:4Fe-4S dicluster domain-containing protein [Acetonema longum]|uniref:Fe-S-cluster-containing hydrogenase component n=1 Tax=Acetonema longum DSM 6540 TaxID=1009370 RepID=F7NGS3_9FIRM|nr:4Fe-4S dicluster domain-containing protein [Acetonema longum]EGO64654.1 Fe-S-cluster-containing hydrogenase component [Acetonema longum DSM 6540]